jgi:hexosaminidase
MFSLLKRILQLILFLLLTGCSKSFKTQNQEPYQSHGIIPLPLSVNYLSGSLIVDSNFVIIGDDGLSLAKNVAYEALNMVLVSKVENDSDTSGKKIILFILDSSLLEEGYEINISEKGIRLASKTPAGAFYAAQTLSQMIWAINRGQKQPSFEIRHMNIKDAPKYSWRGFHIDLSRHLFTKEYIMKVIDELSYYKINKLQLHLTDDQGWRIEIAQYPLLTETGAWRPFNEMDSACMKKSTTDPKYDIDDRFIKIVNGQTQYGGYFSKPDIRDIVTYAGEHFIEVIPEIDMPGHMSAAIIAYSFLSCTGSTGWGEEFSYPICPCNNDVMDFCHGVWDEIAELFPSRFVHLGSDEVDKTSWEASPECQEFMSQNDLHSLSEIQSFFVSDIQRYLESKGKTVVVWDDVIDGNADKNLLMMYWRDWVKDSPDRCAANGNSIILTPWSPFYISSDHTDKTLKALYDYDPETIFSSQVKGKVIGLQSCLWTEEIPSEAMFEYLVYPRMQALAEVAWGTGGDWTTFKIRMSSHLKYMASKNIRYRKPGWAD